MTLPEIRLIIIDDHGVVRAGIRTLLSKESQIKVVGEAESARTGFELCRKLQPDVVLLDIRLPDMNGIDVCRQLKDASKSPAVVFFTASETEQILLQALAAGADGYLVKNVDDDDLTTAVRNATRGVVFMSPAFTRAATGACNPKRKQDCPKTRLDRLSPQELRTVELAATGITNKEIADAMRLTDGTVRNYLSTAFSKLGVQSRSEAVVIWCKVKYQQQKTED